MFFFTKHKHDMKKVLLAACLCAGSFMSAHAGYIMFQNMTNCDFNVNIDGTHPLGGAFNANGVIIPPGVTNFPSPAALPAANFWGAGTLATAEARVAKGYNITGSNGPVFVVGTMPGLTTSYTSVPYAPACYGGSPYVVTFSGGGGNVVVLIF